MGKLAQEMDGLRLKMENRTVRVRVVREIPKVEVGGGTVGPYKGGVEVEMPYWIAEVLEDANYVRFLGDDTLTISDVSKIHWRETLPSSRQIPKLRDDFYFQLRRILSILEKERRSDVSKVREYERAISFFTDILNCRLRKIATLAASQLQYTDLIQNMTVEEKALFNQLYSTVDIWRRKILGEE